MLLVSVQQLHMAAVCCPARMWGDCLAQLLLGCCDTHKVSAGTRGLQRKPLAAAVDPAGSPLAWHLCRCCCWGLQVLHAAVAHALGQLQPAEVHCGGI
jgi:hypothetical protein